MTKKEIKLLEVGDLIEPDKKHVMWGSTDPFEKYPKAYPIRILRVKPRIKVKFNDGEVCYSGSRPDDIMLELFKLKRRTIKYWLKRMSK